MVARDKQRSLRLENKDLKLPWNRKLQGLFCRLFEYQM